jgi:membrane-bound metal-dependent hydrolase YbcI (DUF457 family)
MYTGHVALALAARGLRSDVPLFVLVLASQACDWVALAARFFAPRPMAETYSHAFPFILVAAGSVGVLVWLWKRSLGAALIVVGVYVSHFGADYVTGFKVLWLGGPPVGLRLMQQPVADFIVQASLCIVGFVLYSRSLTAPRTRLRPVVVASPLIFLLSLQALLDLALLL